MASESGAPFVNALPGGEGWGGVDLRTSSGDETRRVAEALGRTLRAGDIISLTGDLGAGKTTFTQGLAIGLGIPAGVVVNSPTFTILAEHPEGRVPLYHFDVYRLSGAGDLYDLAFDEYIDARGVVVVEWADKIAEALPPDTLYISIAFPGAMSTALGRYAANANDVSFSGAMPAPALDYRDIHFRADGPRSTELINALIESNQEVTS